MFGWRPAGEVEFKELDRFHAARILEYDSPTLLFRLACDYPALGPGDPPRPEWLSRRVATAGRRPGRQPGPRPTSGSSPCSTPGRSAQRGRWPALGSDTPAPRGRRSRPRWPSPRQSHERSGGSHQRTSTLTAPPDVTRWAAQPTRRVRLHSEGSAAVRGVAGELWAMAGRLTASPITVCPGWPRRPRPRRRRPRLPGGRGVTAMVERPDKIGALAPPFRDQPRHQPGAGACCGPPPTSEAQGGPAVLR